MMVSFHCTLFEQSAQHICFLYHNLPAGWRGDYEAPLFIPASCREEF